MGWLKADEFDDEQIGFLEEEEEEETGEGEEDLSAEDCG